MKKITLSLIAAVFAIGAAFAGSLSQAGYWLWNPSIQWFDKTSQPPPQQLIDSICIGVNQDCYFETDETGSLKNGIQFRL